MNSATMTKTQVKRAIGAAGIKGKLSGRGTDWEIELADEPTMRRFCREVANAGGFRTGYGSWILQAHYVDLGDPMDKGSLRNYS